MIHAGTDSYYPFHANTHNTSVAMHMHYSPHINYNNMHIAVYLIMLAIDTTRYRYGGSGVH